MNISNFYEHKPENGKPKQIVIMLHGVGSNGQDLISLAPPLSQYLPEAVFISPDAPFNCDMIPAGYPNAYQWFSLQDRNPKIMLEGVENVFLCVEEFIKIQAERYDLPMDKVALLGFSQGTMTSLYTAPRLKNKIAGVLGYSGALLGSYSDVNLQKMPIHLIHGEHDDVVPLKAWIMAKETLELAGYKVSGHTTKHLTHSIDQAGIDSGGKFLQEVLDITSSPLLS